MPDATGIRCYQETAIQTIGPEKLIVLLYEGLVRYLTQARAALVARNMPAKSKHLNDAQTVVIELRNALDHELGGELAGNLEALYNYMYSENINALVSNDPRHVDNCLRVIRPLLDAWNRIPPGTAERARREREAAPQAPPSPAPPATGPDPALGRPETAAGAYGRAPGASPPATAPLAGVTAGLSLTV